MNFTVSYKKIIADYVYNQMIKIEISRKEFQTLQNEIRSKLIEVNSKDMWTSREANIKTYLKQVTEGANLTNITTRDFILNSLSIKNYRIKNRNTIFYFIVK